MRKTIVQRCTSVVEVILTARRHRDKRYPDSQWVLVPKSQARNHKRVDLYLRREGFHRRLKNRSRRTETLRTRKSLQLSSDLPKPVTESISPSSFLLGCTTKKLHGAYVCGPEMGPPFLEILRRCAERVQRRAIVVVACVVLQQLCP